MKPSALVVLNPSAGGGRAPARFGRLKSALGERFEYRTTQGQGWRSELSEALGRGVDVVIAAGGDGTVNAVAGQILRGPPHVRLGALGLGSSNDFHKQGSSYLAGIPVRIDPDRAVATDVVRVDCDPSGTRERRHFLVSASCGVTAEANALFNCPGTALHLVKRTAPGVAVLQAAVAGIRNYRPVPASLVIDGVALGEWAVANLSLLKTPWLAGALRFDTPVSPSSGLMAVNLCHDMSRLDLARVLLALARGSFRALRRTRHWMARSVDLTFLEPTLLELDGEVIRMTRARCEVLTRRLPICA